MRKVDRRSIARAIRVTRGQLRSIIREEARRLREGSLPWSEWLVAFDEAVQAAGYDVKSDLPAYEFVDSEDGGAEEIDRGIRRMYQADLQPGDAVAELEDRDGFHDKWISRGDA